jgi:protein gp37
MATTKIPYCDATWDLTIGCRKRSPGCDHCWAVRTVHRLQHACIYGYCAVGLNGRVTNGTQVTAGGNDWLASRNVNLLDRNLGIPLKWKKPRFIFVNSKSDLFDERVPFEYIGQAFDVMAQARQHRFMVLTKEPERLAEFVDWYVLLPSDFPHVILMTSIESAEYLHRWETLARIPAALRGISFEPLLGPVSGGLLKYLADIQCSNCGWLGFVNNDTPEGGLAREYDGPKDRDGHWECPQCGASDACCHDYAAVHNPFGDDPRPDWIVVGCEKFAGGRPGRWANMQPNEWWREAGKIVQVCSHAAVPVWMKQGPHGVNGIAVVTERMDEFPEPCRIQQPPPWPSPLVPAKR